MFHPDQVARMNQLQTKHPNKHTIQVKKLSKTATIPTKAHNSDAGWDLYASHEYMIGPHERFTIKTGISLQIPDGYVGLSWPRSGLAVKQGADVLAGVIDSGYRGEIMVCLLNTQQPSDFFGYEDYIKIKSGDRIAQILFQEVPHFELTEIDTLQDTDRSDSGFGSSGK